MTEWAISGGGLGPSEAVADHEDDEVADAEPLEDPGHSEPGHVDPAAESVEDEPEEPELD